MDESPMTTRLTRAAGAITERQLMFALVVAFWVVTLFEAIFAGALSDEAQTNGQQAIRIAIGVSSVVAIGLVTFWLRGRDDERVQQFVVVSAVPALIAQVYLSSFGPAALAATYVAIAGLTLLSGQCLSLRGIVAAMTVLTAVAGGVAALNHDAAGATSIVPQVVGLIPVLWSAALATYVLRRERDREQFATERFAFDDPTTGLVNPAALRLTSERLSAGHNARINVPTGVIVVEMLGLAEPSMLLGLATEEELQRAAARALLGVAPASHSLARSGRGEFMIFVTNAEERKLAAAASRYATALATVAATADEPGFDSRVVAGYAIGPRSGSTFDELVAAADRSFERQRRSAITYATTADTAAIAKVDREPTAKRQAWLEGLDWENHRVRARFISISWLASLAGVALALTLPGATVSQPLAVVIALILGGLIAGTGYLPFADEHEWRNVLDLAIAYIFLAVCTSWTGGASSPVWPVALLVVIYSGWIIRSRWTIAKALAGVTVVLAPLAYESKAELAAFDYFSLIAGIVVGLCIAALLFIDHAHVTLAQTMTRRAASIDPRTGVANRRAFTQAVQHAMETARYGTVRVFAVIKLDIGGYAEIKRNHGRAGADDLLLRVGRGLAASSRAGDCVSRLAADEFAILVPGIDGPAARELARRFTNAVDLAISESQHPARDELQPSAGFALFPMHGRTDDALLAAASTALSVAKTTPRGNDRVSSFVVSL